MSTYAEATIAPRLPPPRDSTYCNRPRPRASTYCNRPLPPLPSHNECSRRCFRAPTAKHKLSQFPTPAPLLFPREQVDPLSLKDHTFVYILSNVDRYPPELLAKLPTAWRKKLLSALPPFRLHQLEGTEIARGIDTDEMWETLSKQQDCVWRDYLRDEERGTTTSAAWTDTRKKESRHNSPSRVCFVNYLSHLMFNEMNRDYACKRITELLHAIHVDVLDKNVANALTYGHVTSLFMFQPPYYLLPFRCQNLTERELYWLLHGNKMLPTSLELYVYNIESSPLWNQEGISQGLMRRLLSKVRFLRVYNHARKTLQLEEIMNAVTHSSHYKDPPSTMGSLKHLEILRADDRHLSSMATYFSAPHGYSNLTSLTLSMRPIAYIQATRHLGPVIRRQMNTLQHLELRHFICCISNKNVIDLRDYMFFTSLSSLIQQPRFRSLSFKGFTNLPWKMLRMMLEANMRTVPAQKQTITFQDVNVIDRGELPFSHEEEDDADENQFYPASESSCLEHKRLHFLNARFHTQVLEWFKTIDRLYLNTLEFRDVRITTNRPIKYGRLYKSNIGKVALVVGRDEKIRAQYDRKIRPLQLAEGCLLTWQQKLRAQAQAHNQFECRLFVWEDVKIDYSVVLSV